MKDPAWKLIDLSHKLLSGMSVYPGDPPVEISSIADYQRDGYRMLRYSYGAHSGTHIDAPSHIIPGGKNLDDYPAEYFVGSCQTIDCRDMTTIGKDDLLRILTDETTDFILLHTKADQQWGTAAYFRNYPVLSQEAASLLASLPLRGLGIDAPSFDAPVDKSYPNHQIFLNKDILLIENLTGLGQTSDQIYTLFCFPINIAQSEASPCRVCASSNQDLK